MAFMFSKSQNISRYIPGGCHSLILFGISLVFGIVEFSLSFSWVITSVSSVLWVCLSTENGKSNDCAKRPLFLPISMYHFIQP